MTDGIAPVDQPLFLISQAQRSGGTLLLRLFDGHPECHVVPFQLRGLDDAAKCPPSTLGEAWRMLWDPKLAHRYEEGHRQKKNAVLDDTETFSFELEPERQRKIFDACAGAYADPTLRNLFDCYFTSYFNGWSDYANLEGEKRWLVGFEPGVARSLARRTALRDIYPDGLVVSVLRDPWTWYASAKRWEPRWSEREAAIAHWCKVGAGTLKWRRQKGKQRRRGPRDQVRVAALGDRRDDAADRALAQDRVPAELTQPTFNGRPIKANTSFADVQSEVSTRPLARAHRELSTDDVDYIEATAGELYRKLAKKAVNDWTKIDD